MSAECIVEDQAYKSLESLLSLVHSGALAPSQASKVLSIIFGSFNPVMVGSEWSEIVSELDKELRGMSQPIVSQKFTIGKGERVAKILLSGATVTVAKNFPKPDTSSRTFDTDSEAYSYCMKYLGKLSDNGFKSI